MGKISSPVAEISAGKTDFRLLIRTQKILRRKEWRGEISETEPSPVGRAHMKRQSPQQCPVHVRAVQSIQL